MNVTIGTTPAGDANLDIGKLITSRMLVQANSGGGKSWALRVLAEQIGPHVPIILLDCEGEFATLREHLDIVLVGPGRDIPTHHTTAAALAIKVLETGVSAVIDLFDLTWQERRHYVKKFLDSLMAAPKRLWSPRAVFVDEAHELVPQDGASEAAESVNRLMCQGRKRSFCGILATQRLSKLHKDAAAEANNVLIGRCTLDVDQKRAGEVLGFDKVERRNLRELGEGEFFGFGPAFNFRGVERIKTRRVLTTHGSKASSAVLPSPSKSIAGAVAELSKIGDAGVNVGLDIDGARKRIADLERQLKVHKAQPTEMDPRLIDAIKHQARIDAATGLTSIIAARANQIRDMGIDICATIKEGFGKEERFLREVVSNSIKALEANKPTSNGQHPPRPATAVENAAIVSRVGADRLQRALSGPAASKKSSASQRILDAMAFWESVGVSEPRTEQVAFVARINPHGGYFSNSVGPLTSGGFVERGDGTMRLTKDGRAKANQPQTAANLVDYHAMIRGLLKEDASRRIFDAIVDHGAETIEDIGTIAGIDPSGGYFSNSIGPISTLGLIKRRAGKVIPTDLLAPEGLT